MQSRPISHSTDAASLPVRWSRLLVLSALLLLGGCKVLGVRTVPLEELKEKYETSASRYLEVDGTKVHYRVEGKGPTLVLLHGVLASLHTWDDWVEKLKPHFKIVRIDLPGFGLTGPMAKDNYTPEYAMEFFEMFRAKLGLEKFHLVGNSLGGFISHYYAAHYPQHVDKLILIDPITYPQKLPFIIKFASNSFVGAIATVQSPRFIIKRNVRQVYGDPDKVTDEIIDRYHELLLRQGNRGSMVKYFKTLKKYSTDDTLAQTIPNIKAPTLLMWGESDRWVPIALIERWQHDLPTIQVKTYPGAGHVPMEELPDETAADAFAFLTGAALEDGAEVPMFDAPPAAEKPQMADW